MGSLHVLPFLFSEVKVCQNFQSEAEIFTTVYLKFFFFSFLNLFFSHTMHSSHRFPSLHDLTASSLYPLLHRPLPYHPITPPKEQVTQ